jgi:hypothetical protein
MNITPRIQGFPVDVNTHTLKVLVNIDTRVLKVPFDNLVLKVPFDNLVLEALVDVLVLEALVDVLVLGLTNVDTYNLEVAVLMTDKSNHLQPGLRTLVWIC